MSLHRKEIQKDMLDLVLGEALEATLGNIQSRLEHRVKGTERAEAPTPGKVVSGVDGCR